MNKITRTTVVEVSRSAFQCYAAYRAVKIIWKLPGNEMFDLQNKASDDMKDLLWKQTYFDIFDALYELNKGNYDWTSLLHHFTVITMCQFSLHHPNADKGSALSIIMAIANQFSGVGFNLYKLATVHKTRSATKKAVIKFLLFLQVFYRFPLLCWIAMYQFLMIKQRGIKPQVDAFMITINSIGIFLDYDWIKWSLKKLHLNKQKHTNSAMIISIVFACIVGRKIFK